MAHDHGHGHRHRAADGGDARLGWAVAVNVVLTLAQVVGGALSGSLALVADAIHNLSDAGSLLIALLARRISRRPADARMTFGYGRAEVIAALINLTTLIVIGLYLVYEAVVRFFAPEPVGGWIMIWVASIALVVDLATAALTYRMAKGSLNVRAAFLHNVADALGSVAVIVAGGLILLFGWTLADPIVTLLIAGYVLWHGFTEIGESIRILMGATPSDLDIEEVARTMAAVPGISSVHHLHVWALDEHRRSLEAHVVIDPAEAGRIETLKTAVKALLSERFRIGHSTLEMELAGDAACAEDAMVGHR